MLTSTCAWVMKLMLRHGWGGGDWDVDVHLHLRREVDAASRMGATRGNKLGRLAPSKSHVDPLAMQRLLDKPGFETLLEAMQFYRSKRMGQLDWSPAAFGVLRGDNSWLNV